MKDLYHPEIIQVRSQDLVSFQLRWILHGIVKLNDTELLVLSYVFLHGRDAIEKMVSEKELSSRKTVENYISAFRKQGLILGTGKETRLNPDIKIELRDMSYILKFQIKDNESTNITNE